MTGRATFLVVAAILQHWSCSQANKIRKYSIGLNFFLSYFFLELKEEPSVASSKGVEQSALPLQPG